MNFLYDKEEGTVITAWEYLNEEERDKMYLELRFMGEKPDNIAICKGSIDKSGNVNLDAGEDLCSCCKHGAFHLKGNKKHRK
jgi:hypothetical protein